MTSRPCACGLRVTMPALLGHQWSERMLLHVRTPQHRAWAARQVQPSFPVPTGALWKDLWG